jgi:hypothetical protein
LTRRQEQLLALIAADKLGTNAITICGNTGDQETQGADLATLRRRERAVKSVARKDLRAVRRRRCVYSTNRLLTGRIRVTIYHSFDILFSCAGPFNWSS